MEKTKEELLKEWRKAPPKEPNKEDEALWELYTRRDEILEKLKQIDGIAPRTITEITEKKALIDELKRELGEMFPSKIADLPQVDTIAPETEPASLAASGTPDNSSVWEKRYITERLTLHNNRPPVETTKKGVEGDREWAARIGMPRSTLEELRRKLVTASPGRPKNSSGNSSGK